MKWESRADRVAGDVEAMDEAIYTIVRRGLKGHLKQVDSVEVGELATYSATDGCTKDTRITRP
jgi:hypothetical protein